MADAWTDDKSEISLTLKPPRGSGEEWIVYRGQDLEQVLAAAERDLDRGLYTRVQAVGAGFRAQYNAAAGLGAKPVPQEELDSEAAAPKDEAQASFVSARPVWFAVPFSRNKDAKAAGLLFSKSEKKWGTQDPVVAQAAEAAGFKRR